MFVPTDEMIETTVGGTPCKARVTFYDPGCPGEYLAAPENCYPGEPEYVEFDLFDMDENHAPWLEKELTPEDTARILEEFKALQEEWI